MNSETNARFERGDVVWRPDPFKTADQPRPWLLSNNDEHPFDDQEYTVATLTTTERDEALVIESDDWVRGEPIRQSYVSPWTVNTLKHTDIVQPQGQVTEAFVRRVVNELNRYLARRTAKHSRVVQNVITGRLLDRVPSSRTVCPEHEENYFRSG